MKVVAVLTESQTKQAFFPYGSHFPLSLNLGNVALSKISLRPLPFRNPTTGTLGNTFLCYLLEVNRICSSSIIYVCIKKQLIYL